MIREVQIERSTWAPPPQRFEAGKQMAVERVIVREIGRKIPVGPTMVAAERDAAPITQGPFPNRERRAGAAEASVFVLPPKKLPKSL